MTREEQIERLMQNNMTNEKVLEQLKDLRIVLEGHHHVDDCKALDIAIELLGQSLSDDCVKKSLIYNYLIMKEKHSIFFKWLYRKIWNELYELMWEKGIHCNCTDAEIAQSFAEDLLPRAESEERNER